MKVYRSRDISVYVMYYIYVMFGPSLLTEYYRLCDSSMTQSTKFVIPVSLTQGESSLTCSSLKILCDNYCYTAKIVSNLVLYTRMCQTFTWCFYLYNQTQASIKEAALLLTYLANITGVLHVERVTTMNITRSHCALFINREVQNEREKIVSNSARWKPRNTSKSKQVS